MNRTRTVTAVVGVVAIIVIGVVGFGAYAFAQSDGDFTSRIGGPPWAQGGGPFRGGWHDGDRGLDPERVTQARADLAADLGAELGTSAEDVEAAFVGVAEQRLSEAVETGDITRAEADEALAAFEAGDLRALFQLLHR